MKQWFAYFLALLAVSFLSSCDECDVDINPAPTPVSFIVRDADGNNLLDPEFEGNILSDDIKVTDSGREYPLILSEWNYNQDRGLHTGKIGEDKIPGIMFWWFYISRDRGGDEFTISWGDGTTDEVKFDYFYTLTPMCNIISHRKIYLNGELKSDNSLVVTIVK